MQRVTLAQPVTLQGAGLFSAQHARVTIEPSERSAGIEFELAGTRVPTQIGSLSTRPVHPVFAKLKPRCTSVGDSEHSIATTEHLLSALFGLGISDALVRVSSDTQHSEIPILDGSAKPFVDAIIGAGTRTLEQHNEPLVVTRPIVIEDADASIRIEPSEITSYTYNLDYPGTAIPSASVTWSGDRDEYIECVAPARTFSLLHEAQAMQSAGLFTHLTPRDMLVIGPDGPIDNSYRLENECARHKLLDLIGDLALIGQPLRARVIATRSGHAMAHDAARAVLKHAKN